MGKGRLYFPYCIFPYLCFMMQRLQFIYSVMILLLLSACMKREPVIDQEQDKMKLAQRLDTLNSTAARADFNAYFNCYTDSAVFTGTDATERWNKAEFMSYAKPYFDKGKAWTFKSVQREITLAADGKTAWFDELLSTRMKICRGSGVMQKVGEEWKIAQYILSMTIPNDVSEEIIQLKSAKEDAILAKFK
jgi:ketosteroid isomerase-like protein